MTVIDRAAAPESLLEMPAAEKAKRWAEDRLVLLRAATEHRLIERASVESGNGVQGIGEPQGTAVGTYVAFDIACTSPIQFIGLPPYAPSKVIAGGEDAFIIAFLFVNPTVDVANGFLVPPTTQLANRNFRVKLDEMNVSDVSVGTNVGTVLQTGTFGSPAASLSAFVFQLSPQDPGPNPKLFEANVVADIDGAVQPYAAFATNFFDVDDDPGFRSCHRRRRASGTSCPTATWSTRSSPPAAGPGVPGSAARPCRGSAMSREYDIRDAGGPLRATPGAAPDPAELGLVRSALDRARTSAPALDFRADPVVQRTTTGARVVHLQQQHLGIAVFEASQTVRFSGAGESLGEVDRTATFLPATPATPRLPVEQAVLWAAARVAVPDDDERSGTDPFGAPLQPVGVNVTGFRPQVLALFADHPDRPTVLAPGPFGAPITASLVWFPVGHSLVLGWQVALTMPCSGSPRQPATSRPTPSAGAASATTPSTCGASRERSR